MIFGLMRRNLTGAPAIRLGALKLVYGHLRKSAAPAPLAIVKEFEKAPFAIRGRHSTALMSDHSYKTLRLQSNWRGRMLFTRQGVAERVLDWAMPALWIISLLATIITFW